MKRRSDAISYEGRNAEIKRSTRFSLSIRMSRTGQPNPSRETKFSGSNGEWGKINLYIPYKWRDLASSERFFLFADAMYTVFVWCCVFFKEKSERI